MSDECNENAKHYQRDKLACIYCRHRGVGISPTHRRQGIHFGRLSRQKHVDVVRPMLLFSSVVTAFMMVACVPASEAYCVALTTLMHRRKGLSAPPLFRTWCRRTKPPKLTVYSAVDDCLELVQKNATGGILDVEFSPNDPTTNDVPDETHLDYLLPSTMNLRNKHLPIDGVRSTARRKPIGVSSSALLPFTETGFSFELNNVDLVNSGKIQSKDDAPASWKDRLIDVSNIASFLCVLDCTLLPLVSVAIPTLSWIVGWIISFAGASAGAITTTNSVLVAFSTVMAAIPAIGHAIALYFVIPVGILTTVVNYVFGHKELRFSLPALLGIILIYTANSNGIGISFVDSWLASVGIIVQTHVHLAHGACSSAVGHACTLGWAHRLTNTIGCGFLLGSNYASRKFMEKKSQGCAASAMAKAWGSEGAVAVCPPGCGCESPVRYGAGGYVAPEMESETFFQWDHTKKTQEY